MGYRVSCNHLQTDSEHCCHTDAIKGSAAVIVQRVCIVSTLIPQRKHHPEI